MNRYKIIFISCLFFVSCEYSPQGSYNAQVKEPQNPPTIAILLNNIGDPIDLAMPFRFEFSINLTTERIYSVEVYFNNNNIYYTDLNFGTFTIDPTRYSNGNYILEFRVYSKTQTQSLADAIGAEAYLNIKQWSVMIDNSLKPINILSITPASGSLLISWEKYTRANFKQYELYKINGRGTGLLNTFTNQNITSYFDKEYIGGKCSYFIKIITESDSKNSETKTYSDSLPKILSAVSESGKIIFTWSRCKYYANFYQYILYKNHPDNWSNAINISRKLSDTVFVYDKTGDTEYCDFYLTTTPQNYYAGLTDYFSVCKWDANTIRPQ